MMPSLILLTIAAMIAMLLFTLSWFLNRRATKDREKTSPFECGFDPTNSARVPFSLRFFLLAVIFLMFDIEIVLLLPLPKALQLNHISTTVISISLFLILLLIGLIHEWREGALEWH